MASFAATPARFDLPGLDYTAPGADFHTMLATGKPVIAHVIDSATAAKTALADRADGLMVSDVRDVIPRA